MGKMCRHRTQSPSQGSPSLCQASGVPEAPLFHPQWALRAFMDFQIPEDLCAGYGYQSGRQRVGLQAGGEGGRT